MPPILLLVPHRHCFLHHQFHFIKIIVGFNTVSLSLSSSVGADHFFLDSLLEGLVKFLSMLIAVLVNFLGQWLKSWWRPSLDHPHGKWLVLALLTTWSLVLLVALVNLGDWQGQCC